MSKPSRAAQIRSLMEDSGYSRAEAATLVDAGFSELETCREPEAPKGYRPLDPTDDGQTFVC